jgi:hypothetical protein
MVDGNIIPDDQLRDILTDAFNYAVEIDEVEHLLAQRIFGGSLKKGDKFILIFIHHDHEGKELTHYDYVNDGLDFDKEDEEDLNPDVELNMTIVLGEDIDRILKEYECFVPENMVSDGDVRLFRKGTK